MMLFRPKLSTKSLANVLMQYTITGEFPVSGDTRFALGPHGIHASDGAHVLPENEIRISWDQLNARDWYVINLETMYLRGFVATVSVEAFVKPGVHREVLSHFKSFWRSWSKEGSLDYAALFDTACTIYGAFVATPGFAEDQRLLQAIGRQFSDGSNPFGLLGENLREELASKGAKLFSNSADDLIRFLELTVAKFKLIED